MAQARVGGDETSFNTNAVDDTISGLAVDGPGIQEWTDANGQGCFFINAFQIMAQKTAFYRGVLRNLRLYNHKDPVHCFFVDDQRKQICGAPSSIRFLAGDDFLHSDFKKDHLRILKFKPGVHENYKSLMVAQRDDSKKWRKMKCIERMKTMKAVGNAVYKSGGLDICATALYMGAITQFDADPFAKHAKCKHTQGHDELLSQLLNNVAVIDFKNKKLESSAHYSRQALLWNPSYSKCRQRLRIIEDSISLVD